MKKTEDNKNISDYKLKKITTNVNMSEVNDDEVRAPMPVVRQRLIDVDAMHMHAYQPYGDDIPEDILLESILLDQERIQRIKNEERLKRELEEFERIQHEEIQRRITERENKYQRFNTKIQNLKKFLSLCDASDILFVESILRQYIHSTSDTLFIPYTDHLRFTNIILKNFREAEYGDIFTVIRKIPSQLSLKKEDEEVEEEAQVYEYEDGEEY